MTEGPGVAKISFFEAVRMSLRKVDVGAVRRSLAAADAAGLDIPVRRLETHALAGGDPERVVAALAEAGRPGVPAGWMELAALDLGGRGDQLMSLVRACGETRTAEFATFRPDGDEPIEGFCRDGSLVSAVLVVDYRLPMSHVYGPRLEVLHERLAARTASHIFTSQSPPHLLANAWAIEADLHARATEVMPTVRAVRAGFSDGE